MFVYEIYIICCDLKTLITQYIVSFCTSGIKMYEIFTIDFCVKHRTYFQYRIKHKNRIQSKKSLTLLKPDLVMEGNIYIME